MFVAEHVAVSSCPARAAAGRWSAAAAAAGAGILQWQAAAGRLAAVVVAAADSLQCAGSHSEKSI